MKSPLRTPFRRLVEVVRGPRRGPPVRDSRVDVAVDPPASLLQIVSSSPGRAARSGRGSPTSSLIVTRN